MITSVDSGKTLVHLDFISLNSLGHLTTTASMISTEQARFEKGTRFYQLSLLKDLLGDWVVVRVNGQINSAMGQIHTSPFESQLQAEEFYQQEYQRRLKRGYAVVIGK